MLWSNIWQNSSGRLPGEEHEGRSSRASCGGFTMLELLVAISLLAILATALYGTFFALTSGRDRATAGMEGRRELRTTIDMLRRELDSALFVKSNQRLHFVVEDRDYFGKPASILDFTTFSPPRSGTQPLSDQTELQYRPLGKDGKLLLARLAKDIYLTEKAFPYPQMDELEGFLVECFDGTKWVRSWNTALNPGLPKAVRVTISVKEGDKSYSYAAVATPRVVLF